MLAEDIQVERLRPVKVHWALQKTAVWLFISRKIPGRSERNALLWCPVNYNLALDFSTWEGLYSRSNLHGVCQKQ